jgi:hypothetical protein
MSRRVPAWTLAIAVTMSVLGGCAEASPTPIVVVPPPATSAAVQPIPTAALPVATDPGPTEATAPTATGPTSTPGGTVTPATLPPTEHPLNRPFLMKIDRVSVIVGRGTLLEGRVSHGTLQASDSVEILGPQNTVLATTVLGVFISSTVRDQVTVGDAAGILVESTSAAGVSPGMLLAESGAYTSHEEALQALQ